MELSYGSVIHWSTPKYIYTRQLKTNVHGKTCTHMFMIALFIILKEWKQPKCQSTDEWINTVWCIHMSECYWIAKRVRFWYVLQCGCNLKALCLVKEDRHERPCVCSVVSSSLWPPWTTACQAPLTVEFSRQEYWKMVPFPLPGDFPNPGIKPVSLTSPALAGVFFTITATWEAHKRYVDVQKR